MSDKSTVTINGAKFCVVTKKSKSPRCYIMDEDFAKKFEHKMREKPHNLEILNNHYDELLVKMEQQDFDFKKWLQEKENEANVG